MVIRELAEELNSDFGEEIEEFLHLKAVGFAIPQENGTWVVFAFQNDNKVRVKRS